MPGYRTLIEALDTEPRMVEIEATIIDLDTDRLRELGVDWRLDDRRGSVLGDDAFASDTGATALDAAGADLAGGGGVVSLVLGDELRFLSRIRALESQGAARIVSKPHVITLANVEALLDSTSTFYVRVAGRGGGGPVRRVGGHDAARHAARLRRRRPHGSIKLLVAIEDGSDVGQPHASTTSRWSSARRSTPRP